MIETPALHKKWIDEGKITPEQSQKMVDDCIEREARKAIIEKAEAEDRIVNYQEDE